MNDYETLHNIIFELIDGINKKNEGLKEEEFDKCILVIKKIIYKINYEDKLRLFKKLSEEIPKEFKRVWENSCIWLKPYKFLNRNNEEELKYILICFIGDLLSEYSIILDKKNREDGINKFKEKGRKLLKGEKTNIDEKYSNMQLIAEEINSVEDETKNIEWLQNHCADFSGNYESLYLSYNNKNNQALLQLLLNWERLLKFQSNSPGAFQWKKIIQKASNKKISWISDNPSFSFKILYEIAENWLNFIDICNITRINENELKIDEQTSKYYYINDVYEIGDKGLVIRACWKLGDKVVEYGMVKPL